MSVASSGVKKRKKTENKPQSQINKCLNEKRRREQENIFIEELAELISVSFSDMNSLSVKPDKCAILQETVHQIRNIKQRQQQEQELQQQQNQPNQQGVVSTDDIQQGEVSSSKPTVLSNAIFGPLLLEALEGFAFLLNQEGKVEYVTDNVSQFIKYSKDEILGKNIYSIVHPHDHGKFSSILLPTSVGNWSQSGSGSGANQQPKHRPFNCKFLIKYSDDSDESVVDNKEHTSNYDQVQISSTLSKGEGTYVSFQISSTLLKGDGVSGSNGGNGNNEISSECGEMGPGLICVARRIPTTEKHMSPAVEQFTTKLDPQGKIIGIDTSGVSSTYSLYLNKDLKGKALQELCYGTDLYNLTAHLKEVHQNEKATSKIYRLMISPEKYLHIQTNSRLFRATPGSGEPDFIMAAHSIISENDVCQLIESASLNPRQSSSLGGGPMMNALNGRLSAVTTPDNSNAMTLNNNNNNNSSSSNNNNNNNNNNNSDYSAMSDMSMHDFDFFSRPDYDMEDRTPWSDRPESRHSLNSAPSPMFSHPSPAPNAPSTPYGAPLPFSPLDNDMKDNKDMIMAEVNSINDSCESARLRNLLTTKKSNSHLDSEDQKNNRNKQILENLLNPPEGVMDIDGADAGPSPKQRRVTTPSSMNSNSDSSSSYQKSAGGSNTMLLTLLNKKPLPDSEDTDTKTTEYLHQILKDGNGNQMMMEQELQHQQQVHQQLQSVHRIPNEDTILEGIGFLSSPSSPPGGSRLRKRPSEELDENGIPSKRNSKLDSIPPPPPVAIANNKLREKNKTLLQLLAKDPPKKPEPIPHLPPSVISAKPQDRLPKVVITTASSASRPNTSVWATSNSQQQQQQLPGQIRMTPQQQRAPTSNPPTRGGFLNELLQSSQQQQQMQQQQLQLPHQLRDQMRISNNNNILPWDSHNSDDHDLNKLLDQLFENAPDAISEDPNLLGLIQSVAQGDVMNSTDNSMGVNNVTLNNVIDSSNEKMAIHAIKNSFMSYEQQATISNRMQQQINQSVLLQHQQQQQQQLQQQQQNQQAAQQQKQAHLTMNQSGQPFPPPPMYQQRPNRLQTHQNSVPQLGNRPMTQQQQFAVATSTGQFSPAQVSQAQNHARAMHMQQKRLLMLQQHQMVIPSNAATNSQGTTSLQNIDSLLNNAAPPNVSLQRSTSLTSEGSNAQQLSPGGSNNPLYNNTMLTSSQISPPQRQPPSSLASPYSPLSTNHQQQSFSNLNFTGASNQQAVAQSQGARLSPSGLSPFQAQLSPRVSQPQTTFTGTSVMASGAQQSQMQQQSNWASQQPQQSMVNNRMSLQQQQNPMLDARLSGGVYTGNRAALFAQQSQKSQQAQSPQLSQVRGGLTSPGPRQSPFPADISPTTATSYAAASHGQYRLQRTMSVPNSNMAASQVPPGNNCIRAYSSNTGASLNFKDTSQTPPHPPPLYSPVMYQHHGESSPYCYPDQSLPMYGDRSRVTHPSGGNNNVNNNNNNNNGVNEFVRRELRTVVTARQQQGDMRLPPLQVGPGQQTIATGLEHLGLSLEMPNDDDNKWGGISNDMTEGSPSAGFSVRTSLDDVNLMRSGVGNNANAMNQMGNVGGGEKASLLQKLLSE
nr:taiman isoform 5A_IN-1 [Planococcus kraunhiae]